MAVADRFGVHFAAAQAVLVEERLQRAAHQQRRQIERGRFFGSVYDRRQEGAILESATFADLAGPITEPAFPRSRPAPQLPLCDESFF